MIYDYAIVVKSKTRLESLIERFNTKAQAKFYIERLGGDFEDYEYEDAIFKQSLDSLQTQLSKLIKNKTIDKQYLPSYLFADKNLIIVVGQDGLVANTAKYSLGLPIIAVNPDVQRYDGILLPFNISNFIEGVEDVISNNYSSNSLRFAEAKLNNGQRLLAFNDIFIGTSSHSSARYRIRFKDKNELHSSSGIIVSTKAGSTGWLSSIFNMAYGVVGMFDNNLIIKQPTLREEELLFAVREPFKSIRTQTDLIAGVISNTALTVESLMPNNGIIFSDGIQKDFLEFNSGSIATITISKESAKIVINRDGEKAS